jgi:hypothetical protein
MTISASQILAGIAQGVSAVDAALDDGLTLIPELAVLKPYIDMLNSALQDVEKIAASKATLAAKLAAGQVAVADAAAAAAEAAKFPPAAT